MNRTSLLFFLAAFSIGCVARFATFAVDQDGSKSKLIEKPWLISHTRRRSVKFYTPRIGGPRINWRTSTTPEAETRANILKESSDTCIGRCCCIHILHLNCISNNVTVDITFPARDWWHYNETCDAPLLHSSPLINPLFIAPHLTEHMCENWM